MKQYLLDTNICIYFLKGMYDLGNKIKAMGVENCFISEITVAEMKFGIENSPTPQIMQPIVEQFIEKARIVPIYNALDIYAKEKAKLKRNGLLIDDFDILIGATAIYNNLIMVTNNIKHFDRLNNISIEDWTKM